MAARAALKRVEKQGQPEQLRTQGLQQGGVLDIDVPVFPTGDEFLAPQMTANGANVAVRIFQNADHPQAMVEAMPYVLGFLEDNLKNQ